MTFTRNGALTASRRPFFIPLFLFPLSYNSITSPSMAWRFFFSGIKQHGVFDPGSECREFIICFLSRFG